MLIKSLFLLTLPALCQNTDTLFLKHSFKPEAYELISLPKKPQVDKDIEIITASRSKEKASLAPATVFVITQEQIFARQYTSLDEVLADIPEIEVQRNSDTEFSNIFTLRGVKGNDKFIILMDGVRVNAASSSPMVIGQNFMVQHAKQIEILIGPASALYGADAFTGVVNIITKTGKNTTQLSSGYGRFGTFDNNFSSGFQVKNASVLLFGKYFSSQEPNYPQFYPKDFQWYNEVFKPTGNVRTNLFDPIQVKNVGYKPFSMPLTGFSFGSKVQVSGLDLAIFTSREVHSSAISDKSEFAVYEPDNKYETNVTVWNLSYQRSFDKLQSKTSFTFNNMQIGNSSRYQNVYSSQLFAYKYSNESTFQVDQQFNYSLTEKTAISAGFLYQKFIALPKTNDLPVPFENNNYFNLIQIGTDLKDKDGKSLAIAQDFFWLNYLNYGGFLQTKTDLLNSLSLTVGIRYDYNTRFHGSFNPRLGLVYNPINKLKLKILYGEAFLAASPYNTYVHYGSFVPIVDQDNNYTGFKSFFFHLPNPNLRPEKNRSIEGSFLYNLSNAVSISADFYYSRQTSLIKANFQDSVRYKGQLILTAEIYENTGQSTTYGGTFKIEGRFIRNNFKLNGFACYTFNDGSLNNSFLPLSSRHTGRLILDMSYKKLSLSPKLLYRTSSLHPILVDEDKNPIKNPDFFTLDFTTNYQFTKNINGFVKFNNLLDRRYYHVSNLGLSSMGLVPQMPLFWLVGFNFNL